MVVTRVGNSILLINFLFATWRSCALQVGSADLRAGRLRKSDAHFAAAQDTDERSFFEAVKRRIELSRRPPPVLLPRAKLSLDFAVLLMRTSYIVADDLDFVPMDQFQKNFFLFRQGEWKDFLEQHPGLKQGDISDPNYFDFISFAQYAAISKAMERGQKIFTELVGAEGESRTVQRSPQLSDNEALPVEHSKRVGDIILDSIFENFKDNADILPEIGRHPSIQFLAEGVDRILNILRLFSYFGSYQVTPVTGKLSIIVTAMAPATIWGQQVLALRNEKLRNDFESKIISSYLRRCEVEFRYKTSFRGLEAIHIFEIKQYPH